MSTISKRDAAELAASIRRCMVAGHEIAKRGEPTIYTHGNVLAGFVGGLESVLQSFVAKHCDGRAGIAIAEAFNHEPTAEEIAEMRAERQALRERFARERIL